MLTRLRLSYKKNLPICSAKNWEHYPIKTEPVAIKSLSETFFNLTLSLGWNV
jgi:hypothetical protein